MGACRPTSRLGCNLHGLHSDVKPGIEPHAVARSRDKSRAGDHRPRAGGCTCRHCSWPCDREESSSRAARERHVDPQSPHQSRRQSRSRSRRQSRRQSRCRLLGRVNLLNLSTISSAELRCRRRCAAGPWAATSARRRDRREIGARSAGGRQEVGGRSAGGRREVGGRSSHLLGGEVVAEAPELLDEQSMAINGNQWQSPARRRGRRGGAGASR